MGNSSSLSDRSSRLTVDGRCSVDCDDIQLIYTSAAALCHRHAESPYVLVHIRASEVTRYLRSYRSPNGRVL